jgi:hypothetical protein
MRMAKAAIQQGAGGAANSALDAAVGALAALAAADAVLALGEAQVAAALRVTSLLLPVRVAINPRAVVGQGLQLAIDAARTGFRPAMLFPFLVDGRVNNFQELAGFAAQSAVDRVTSGANRVIAGFDQGARRWWRARSRRGDDQRGQTSKEALEALAAGPFVGGGGGLRMGGGGGSNNNGSSSNNSSSRLDTAAAAAAVLPPALSALLLRAAAAAASSSTSFPPPAEGPDLVPAKTTTATTYSTTTSTTTNNKSKARPLADELRATLAVAGDVFVEWSRASASDLERAAATLDAVLPGPSPAKAVGLARQAISTRARASRQLLERAFPSQDVLETSDILHAAADEILAAVEEAAATAISPDAPGIVAARETLRLLTGGMRFAAAPLGAAADAAFRSPPPLANATLAAVRALAQEGADEVEAAAARVLADYGAEVQGTARQLRASTDAAILASRRAADRALSGAADAASSMVVALAASQEARALAEGLPGAIQPLVRAFAAVVLGGEEAGLEGGGDREDDADDEQRRWRRERAAWERAAAALDSRAGQELRDLARRVESLAEAVPVAAEALELLVARGEQAADAAWLAAQPVVAAAAALLESAASGRVANARGALQGALLRLNVEDVVEEGRRRRVMVPSAQEEVVVADGPEQQHQQQQQPPRRLRAGGDGSDDAPTPTTATTNSSSSSPPSLASRVNVELSRVADGAVDLSRAALERGAEVSMAVGAGVLRGVQQAAVQGGAALAALASDWQPNRASALLSRAREAADAVSLGIRDSLSPVVQEGVRAGERLVRAGLDGVLLAVAGGGG